MMMCHMLLVYVKGFRKASRQTEVARASLGFPRVRFAWGAKLPVIPARDAVPPNKM